MTAVDRREEILDYLAANRSATAPELAVRFQVSAKTIRRDLEWLSHGYPLEIIPGNGGGVRVMDGRYIYRGKFTPEEEKLMRRLNSLLQGEDRQIMAGILRKYSHFCAEPAKKRKEAMMHGCKG